MHQFSMINVHVFSVLLLAWFIPYLFYNGISSLHIHKMVNDGRVRLQADVKMLVVSVIDPKT